MNTLLELIYCLLLSLYEFFNNGPAHENLTENWKEEALRLAEVNKKACAQQTIDKLNELALDNAELKRKLAAAELKGTLEKLDELRTDKIIMNSLISFSLTFKFHLCVAYRYRNETARGKRQARDRGG